MKTCTTCSESKPFDAYYKTATGNPQGQCKACRAEKQKAWLAQGDNAERQRQNQKRWNAKYNKRHAAVVRERRLAVTYGLKPGQYDEMLKAQDGKCGACGSSETGWKHPYFQVDHDHATNAVRSLLCAGCNGALGAVNDSAERLLALLAYLERHAL